MTVAELIKQLEALPLDAIVVNGNSAITSVECYPAYYDGRAALPDTDSTYGKRILLVDKGSKVQLVSHSSYDICSDRFPFYTPILQQRYVLQGDNTVIADGGLNDGGLAALDASNLIKECFEIYDITDFNTFWEFLIKSYDLDKLTTQHETLIIVELRDKVQALWSRGKEQRIIYSDLKTIFNLFLAYFPQLSNKANRWWFA